MKTNPLQQAIAAEKRRRGAPWTYHERDPAKMVENVKRMVALRMDIYKRYPGMPESLVEHAVKRARGSRRPASSSWTESPEVIVDEFALFISNYKSEESRKLVKRWSKKGSKCTHQ